MDLELNGKVALVTGASRGIGRAIAEGLAAEGVRLVITARGAEALEETQRALQATGAEVLAVPADVGDDTSVTALVEQAREHFGRIDILISNASALAVSGDRASWEASLNVDVMGAVRLVEAVLPMMKAEGGGSVLLVSSTSSIEAAPMEDFGYTAAKAALNAYAKKLAVVEGSHGIRTNALLPGSTEFPGGGWEMMREHQPTIYEIVRQSVPSGRLGTPKEIADAAVWLVSPRAGWVNGAALVVDGGQSKAIP
ncbi:MAG: SDR family oxidoreductase [Gammaproteobacteria bacterium]|nr:MAG: SDR family oxidoreductase [Gammaproteobacteria bacterium]